MKYVIGIDQSTQGTKVILFDSDGRIRKRVDRSHRQLIDERGYVSHDMEEIYRNLTEGVKMLLADFNREADEIAAVGISNQRETTAAWRRDGKPLGPAVVWQCARAGEIAERHKAEAAYILERTGLVLSPFFPAAKMQWLMEHGLSGMDAKEICLGTVDSFLVYRLTGGEVFATDYSNASRTQLFDIHDLAWNETLCRSFGVDVKMLPEVRDSNGDFGSTDFEGILPGKVPIRSVLGDSHAALYGQGCHKCGMIKATYGTGSSIMMHTGEKAVPGTHSLAVSLAWGIDGKMSYVLEGNINYTGAVVNWLGDNLELIRSPKEVEGLVAKANREDTTVMVPAFTGLSAPHWNHDAKAAVVGMTRTTGKAEFVKAAVESIAQQIADVTGAMEEDCGGRIREIRTDGGPTRNAYLMQFQSDLTGAEVLVSETEELSAAGAAYLAGITAGCMEQEAVFSNIAYRRVVPRMQEEERKLIRSRWKNALRMVCTGGNLI